MSSPAWLIVAVFLQLKLADCQWDCSRFSSSAINHHKLVECPNRNEDFLQCYDLPRKINEDETRGYGLRYWCWNRFDNDESIVKNITISTTYLDIDNSGILNLPFSSIFYFNGTHMICIANEEWVSDKSHDIICATSTGIPVANFQRYPFDDL